ncbi:MAG: hypothetical protein ACI9HB_001476, partial [Gammaproteobacteria bacterium]
MIFMVAFSEPNLECCAFNFFLGVSAHTDISDLGGPCDHVLPNAICGLAPLGHLLTV